MWGVKLVNVWAGEIIRIYKSGQKWKFVERVRISSGAVRLGEWMEIDVEN